MVIPPQRMATVSLTMGGVIKSTSLLPGEPVRQGSVLATLENPDFITLQQTYLDSHAPVSYTHLMLTLPIDAVPDITNNQVQIVTVSPTLAPQEVEQLITMPVEIAMSNIMNVTEIRSVSRFGLSVVTVVFKESVPCLLYTSRCV